MWKSLHFIPSNNICPIIIFRMLLCTQILHTQKNPSFTLVVKGNFDELADLVYLYKHVYSFSFESYLLCMLVRLNIWFSSEMGLLSWLFCFWFFLAGGGGGVGWGSLFHSLRLGPSRNIYGLLDFVVYYPKSLIGLIVGHLFSNLVLCKYELFLRKPVP